MTESGRRVGNKSFLFIVLVGNGYAAAKSFACEQVSGKRAGCKMMGEFDRCRSVPFNAPAGAVSENAANAEVPALTRQNASCATSLLCYGGGAEVTNN